MSSIDERIVDMQFNNKQFESGVKTTQGSLAALQKSLQLAGGTKGLENVSAAASKVNLGPISSGIDALVAKFNTLSVVGLTAITNIANRAIDAGIQLTKSLTIGPISDGFDDYNKKLTSIQTVVNATGRDLKEVNGFFTVLDKYADTTVFKLDDMTGALAKFVNAGVSLEDAIPAIQGIGNMTALAGQGASEASIAYYNLAQSLSQGFLSTTDFKSLQLANVATSEWKQHMLDAAVAAGTIKKSGKDMYTVLSDGSNKAFTGAALFTTELSRQWATADVLKDVLKDYGDETTAIGKKAFAAAKDVKSLPMMFDTLKAAVGTGWTDTFEIVLGDLEESKELFTGLTNAIGGWLGGMSDARNELLKSWKDLGGRTALIEGLKNAFAALAAVFKPIKDAFREIFPATTGQQLADLTKRFQAFTEKLKIGAESSAAIRETFKAVFSIFKILGQVLSGVIHLFTSTVGLMTGMGSAGVGLVGSIAGIVNKFTEWVLQGDKIKKFFDMIIASREKVFGPIYDFVAKLIDAFSAFATGGFDAFVTGLGVAFGAIGPIIDGITGKFEDIVNGVRNFLGLADRLPKFSMGMEGVSASLEVPATLGDMVYAAWQKVVALFGRVKDSIGQMFSGFGNGAGDVGNGIVEVFAVIKDKVVNFVKGLGIEEALALINTGFFIALYRMLRGFVKSLKEVTDNLAGVLESASGVLDQVTDNLKTMQNAVRAEMILKIAIAVGVLAASLFVLSKIDVQKLAISLGAVAILMGILVVAMKQLDQEIAKGAGKEALLSAARMTIVTVALVGLGIALLAMAAAVAIFGNMDLETLAKGLGAVAVALGVMLGASAILDKAGGDKAMIRFAIAIGLMAGALTLLAGALLAYAMIDTGTLVDGGLKVVAVLAAMVIFMRALPEDSLKKAGAIIIVAGALSLLAGVLKVFSMMDIGDMIQSMVMLAGVLTILAVAVRSMEGSVRGAAALLIVAAALNLFVPVLVLLGSLDLAVLATGLAALAIGLGILLAAAYGATIVAPGLIILGQAIALLGLAALAAGAGMFLFATGIAALAAAGAAGVAALTATIIAVAQLLPLIMQQFGLGIIAFAKVISTSGPVLVGAFSTVLTSMLQAIINNIPKVRELLQKLIAAAIDVLTDAIPRLATAGVKIILGILEGMRGKIGKIADVAGDLIVEFINAIQRNYNKIIDGAAKAILKFITELTNSINKYSSQLGTAGGKLLVAIMQGFSSGIGAAAGEMWNYAKRLASNFIAGIKNFLGIASPSKVTRQLGEWTGEGFIEGVDRSIPKAGASAREIGKVTVEELRDSLKDMNLELNKQTPRNFQPTIRPVLDLSDVKRTAPELDSILDRSRVLTPRPAWQTVSAISATAVEDAPTDNFVNGSRKAFGNTFIQNNYSPKALSSAEIYRQTNNQLSRAREEI